MTLEVTGILLETLPKFHLDGKEVIVVLPQLPSGSALVVEILLHLLEVPERLPRERIEPVVGDTFETGQEYTTQERVIVGVNRHLVLVLAEMLDGVGRS